MNNLANQFHQTNSSTPGATIVSIPLITTHQAADSNNLNSSPNSSNLNNRTSNIIQITTQNNNGNVSSPIQIENNNVNTTPTAHVKLSNSIKINQLPINLSTSSIVLAQPGSTNNNPPSNLNNNTTTNATNSYGGFGKYYLD
jgi:hypothetical protein